jgi:phosphoglycerate dehydrogenase-like enzyme
MKILVTPTSIRQVQNSDLIARLESVCDEIVYNPHGRPLRADELPELLTGCQGYLAGLDFVTADVIRACPDLKVISRYGAGVDRVDLEAARDAGIRVTTTPGANSTAVAELAMGLILSLARRIPALDRSTRAGGWIRATGMEISGGTIGIVGLGAIGKKLATMAHGFGMTVTAHDPYADTGYASAHGISLVSLESLIARSDVISLHLPLTGATRHVIGAEQLDRMKDSVLLVNTSRGGLIDEAAALAALRAGTVGGIGLDAFEEEPPAARHELFAFDNVVVTPHTGAHTTEATRRMAELSVENLVDGLTSASPSSLRSA